MYIVYSTNNWRNRLSTGNEVSTIYITETIQTNILNDKFSKKRPLRAMNTQKNYARLSVHVFWARLAGFAQEGLVSGPQINFKNPWKCPITVDVLSLVDFISFLNVWAAIFLTQLFIEREGTFMVVVWCCYIIKEIPHMPLKQLENDLNLVLVQVSANKTTHYITSWYREPSGFQLFPNQLEWLRLQTGSSKLPSVQVLGD